MEKNTNKSRMEDGDATSGWYQRDNGEDTKVQELRNKQCKKYKRKESRMDLKIQIDMNKKHKVDQLEKKLKGQKKEEKDGDGNQYFF